ncbi:hypothetical protein MVES1_001809 [Malassezia vespertilionis]|nr:uncharacterized protein MVES1_001809 [Malassezia vespertilionis]WFD06464.1 hypothetical protein MVES1_001809 [Malassezia vespertilionis]
MQWRTGRHVAVPQEGCTTAQAYCAVVESVVKVPHDPKVSALLAALPQACSLDEASTEMRVALVSVCKTLRHAQFRDTRSWECILATLNACPAAALLCHATIMDAVHDPAAPLEHVLAGLVFVLHACAPSQLWETGEGRWLPILVLNSILDHKYLDVMPPELVFAVLALFMRSLYTHAPALYDQSLKLIMHALMEQRQHMCETASVRERYGTMGTLLLEERIVAVLHLAWEDGQSPGLYLRGDPAITTVLELYTPQILQAAEKTPRLARTLGLAMAHDATKVVNTWLYLAESKREMERLRKKYAQKDPMDDGADEHLYREALQTYGAAMQPPTFATEVWRHIALGFGTYTVSAPLAAYFIAAAALCAPVYPAPLNEHEKPKRLTSAPSPAYDTFALLVTQVVVQERHAMMTILELYVHAVDTASMSMKTVLARCLDPLPTLLASASTEMAEATWRLLRTVEDDSLSHFDLLQACLLRNGKCGAQGLLQFLETYQYIAAALPSAVHGAQGTIQFLDELLHVLCDQNFGLLHPFIGWDVDHVVLLALWEAIANCIALIFEKVPGWSRYVSREALLPWLSKVPALVSYMLKSTRIMHEAVPASATKCTEALAVPLDSAILWLRLNNEELLNEVLDYIRRVVQRFRREGLALPQHVIQHAVDFLTQQLDIASDSKRKTLLSTPQLELILEEFLALPRTHRAPPQPKKEGPLRQQTLSFGQSVPVIDLTTNASPKPRPNLFHAAQQLATGNRNRVGRSEKPAAAGALSKFRNEFQATRNIARKPHAPSRTLDPEEPRGPLATTGAAGIPVLPPVPVKKLAVESESESSSSEEEAKGLDALASPRKQAPPKIVQPLRRSVVLLEDAALQNTMRKANDAQRQRRLREPADYSELYKCILSWDVGETSTFPPPFHGDLLNTACKPVSATFSNVQDYMRVYGALFLLECWAQFQQAVEVLHEAESIPVALQRTGSVDTFTDLDCDAAKAPKHCTFSDTDIVCLTCTPKDQKTIRVLGKVRLVQKRIHLSVRLHLTTPAQRSALAYLQQPGWHMSKFLSITTLCREYAALCSVPDLTLAHDILKAHTATRASVKQADIDAAVRKFGINVPQAEAILGSMRTPGFSLIQGPPGTGKTKTISALVATFLSRRRRAEDGSGQRSKLLLCAPSNAAIDEMVARIKDGVYVDGNLIQPRLVRLGREDAVNPAVRDTTLSVVTERRMHVGAGVAKREEKARKRLRQVEEELQRKYEEQSRTNDKGAARKLQLTLNELRDQRMEVKEELESVRRSMESTEDMSALRHHEVRAQVLHESEIVCATLAGAGHSLLYPHTFETVVIDEAVQAVELSALIPLRYQCNQCIMVGDPKQLPPTVISRQAETLGYTQSLFVRMYTQRPDNLYLLNIQYRMHPAISVFPSTAFYDNRLVDGEGMEKHAARPWHNVALFAPFRFLDIGGAPEEKARGHSLQNRAEADAAIRLYEALERHVQEPIAGKVGFVSMYKGQVQLLRSMFVARFGREHAEFAEFSSVDGFQGQEKDIIILSCVRSNAKGVIGFLGDYRRLNVALTRARSNMFVIGNAQMLHDADPVWKKLVGEAVSRRLLLSVCRELFANPMRALPSAVQPPDSSPQKRSIQGVDAWPKRRVLEHDTQRRVSKPRTAGRVPPKAMASAAPAANVPAQAPLTAHAVPQKPPTKVPALPVKPAPVPKHVHTPAQVAPTRSEAPPNAGKWAAIVARAKEKNIGPQRKSSTTPIRPGESQTKADGPSWLRPMRPGHTRKPR